MEQLESYLNQYSESHQNKTNILIHKICVPLIMFSVLGLLKAMPVPEAWPLWLDWSTLVSVMVLVFYACLKDLKIFLSMVVFVLIQILILEWLRPRFFLLCLLLFVIAWIFQFIGHRIEGRNPSFLKNVVFLLIGPVWVLKFFMGEE